MFLKLVKPLGTREHLLRTFTFVTIVINLTGIPQLLCPKMVLVLFGQILPILDKQQNQQKMKLWIDNEQKNYLNLGA